MYDIRNIPVANIAIHSTPKATWLLKDTVANLWLEWVLTDGPIIDTNDMITGTLTITKPTYRLQWHRLQIWDVKSRYCRTDTENHTHHAWQTGAWSTQQILNSTPKQFHTLHAHVNVANGIAGQNNVTPMLKWHQLNCWGRKWRNTCIKIKLINEIIEGIPSTRNLPGGEGWGGSGDGGGGFADIWGGTVENMACDNAFSIAHVFSIARIRGLNHMLLFLLCNNM